MKAYVRPLIAVLAAVAFIASVSALYVHYRLLTDPSYSSFCDINETVSCQQVFESSYGTVAGVPVAAGGAIWSALVFGLAFWGLRQQKSDLASRVAGYLFLLSTIGLATVFYFAYASFVVLGQACPLCMTMYVAVIGIFLVSASAAGSLANLPSRLAADLGGLRTRPVGATLAALWLVGSAALVLLFPQERAVMAPVEQAAAAPPETIAPEQTAEWERWLDAQARAPEVMPAGEVKVLIVKFNDYQCPACRQTYVEYRDIIAKYEQEYPGVFRFETRDFPLEAECGFGGIHGGACEAAVAVRLARTKNRDKELEQWLYANQDNMNRDVVKAALEEIAQVSGSEYDAQYAKVIPEIRADAALGQKLGVNGTPTFFINGIKLPSLRPAYFDAAIAYALKRSGVAS